MLQPRIVHDDAKDVAGLVLGHTAVHLRGEVGFGDVNQDGTDGLDLILQVMKGGKLAADPSKCFKYLGQQASRIGYAVHGLRVCQESQPLFRLGCPHAPFGLTQRSVRATAQTGGMSLTGQPKLVEQYGRDFVR